jgi:hypothetical protein
MFEALFGKKKKEEPKASPKPKKKSDKEIATEKGEPYVTVISMDVDPENLNEGAFELDWNDKFIANLRRAGYQGKEDSDLVDQWFQQVCRNVVLETWEQDQANNTSRFHNVRPIGGGRTVVS